MDYSGRGMMQKKTCTLLYNPISGHGHLDSWLNIFSNILIERGHYVLFLTPDHTSLVKHLEQKGLTESDTFQILDWSITLPRSSIHAWQCFWIRYINEMPCTFAAANASWPERFKKWAIRSIFRIIRTTRNIAFKFMEHTKTFKITRQSDAYLLSPSEMAFRIQQSVKKAHHKPDFVLVMYMDMFKDHPSQWTISGQQMSIPWAGIRFSPRALAKGEQAEGHYADPQLRGMCFLDMKATSDYQKKFPAKIFQRIPDITNASLPTAEPELVQKLRARASGRRIVILGGSLDTRKNISGYYKLATLADPHEWFFALVGRTYPDTFTDADRQALQELKKMEEINTMLHLDYLEDERDFNAMISASDIIFAVYKDFPYSSNMLSKAAWLKRPIIVSDRYNMGKDVLRYGIGRVTDENNPTLWLEALKSLRTKVIHDEAYSRYKDVYSEKALGDALENFINKCRRSSR